MKDVNPKLVPVGPLGKRRGRLFTSMHCRTVDDRRDVVVKVLQRAQDDPEQAEVIRRQEAVFTAIENRVKGARLPNADEPLRAPKALHFLHYSVAKATDLTVHMERSFVQYTLAERLHARPFLSENRRLFVVFQLFRALNELHNEFGVSHGDLKVENVLVNTSGWLYLTDICPYKPNFVESFNPANFEWYFDSAESRVCTLPPERFTDEPLQQTAAGASANGKDTAAASLAEEAAEVAAHSKPRAGLKRASALDGQPLISGHAIPETLEVFSAGCIAAFVLGDEHPFKLSNVLELRTKATHDERHAYVTGLLQGLRSPVAPHIMEFLVVSLIGQRPTNGNPLPPPAATSEATPLTDEATVQSPVSPNQPLGYDRPTSMELLRMFTPTVFPRYFSMLHDNVLPALFSLPPDLQIHHVWTRLLDIVDAAVRCETDPDYAAAMSATATESREAINARLAKNRSAATNGADKATATTGPSDEQSSGQHKAIQAAVLDIIMPVVAGSIRFLMLEDTMLKALMLLERAGGLCSEDCRRDVIIPILVHIVKGNKSNITPIVRAFGLRALSSVCSFIRSLPASECFMFEEYVLPAVYTAVKVGAKSAIVCSAIPRAISKLMNAAMYMVEEREGLGKAYKSRLDFDAQQDAVISKCWDVLRSLLTNPNCSVLCAALAEVREILPLLGLEIVGESLLPLLTTFLGHSAVEVRRGMIAAAVDVALYLKNPNASATATLALLLEESLREKDGRCIFVGLSGIKQIIEQRCLPAAETTRLVHSGIALMAHPSEWVAIAASHLVASAARVMDPVDVLIHLVDPVKALVKASVPIVLLDRLSPRHFVRPEAILAMADSRRRIPCCATYHRTYSTPSTVGIPPGVVAKPLSSVLPLEIVDLTNKEVAWVVKSLGMDSTFSTITSKQKVALPVSAQRAPELPWHMSDFSPTPRQLKRLIWRYRQHRKTVAASGVSKLKRGLNIKDAAGAPAGGGVSSLSFVGIVTAASKQRIPPTPIGVPLMTDATAHQGAITSLTSSRHWLVSSGTDGQVKLWDLSESLRPTAGSVPQHVTPQTIKDAFNRADGAAILFTHFMSDDPQSLVAVGGSNGHLRFLDIGAGKAPIVATVDGGAPGGLSSCVSLDPKVLVLGSFRGGLYAVDTRTPSKEVWSSSLPRSKGPISKMITVSPDAPFGILCGTLRGYLAVLDMRFRGVLASSTLPRSPCIYDMTPVAGATEGGAPNVAVATSTDEVVRIDVSTFIETMTMRPASGNSIRCLASAQGGATLFSGGTDGNLRAWQLLAPESSKTIVPPPYYSQDYNFARGAQTIAEVPMVHGVGGRVPVDGGLLWRDSATCHSDAVTRLCCVSGPGGQQFLISGCQDGSLKLWRNAKSAVAGAPTTAPASRQ